MSSPDNDTDQDRRIGRDIWALSTYWNLMAYAHDKRHRNTTCPHDRMRKFLSADWVSQDTRQNLEALLAAEGSGESHSRGSTWPETSRGY